MLKYLTLIIVFIFSSSSLAEKLLYNETLNAYHITITDAEDKTSNIVDKQTLKIEEGNKNLQTLKGMTITHQLFKNSKPPFLVASAFSGGAHCCASLDIYTLGKTLKHYQLPFEKAFLEKHENISWQKTLDAHGNLLITLQDPFWLYWRTYYADNGSPTIIWSFDGNKFSIDMEKMKKDIPSETELLQEAAQLRQDTAYWKSYVERKQTLQNENNNEKEALEFPGRVTAGALKLLYRGQPTLAWLFVENAWAPDVSGKAAFISALKADLPRSPYWQLLVKTYGFKIE